MNYVTNMLLLVSPPVRSKQLLCFVHGQGRKRKQKHTTKNFVEFHNHSPLLNMVYFIQHAAQDGVGAQCELGAEKAFLS